MKQQPAVSRPLLGLLALTMLIGGYLAQGSLFGSDESGEDGFGDFSPIAFSSDDEEADGDWVMPDNPRNPFLPYFAPEDPFDDSANDIGLELNFSE